MTTQTTARPYRSYNHLRDTIHGKAGAISVQPLRADDIHFDAAWSNYYPAGEGQHGSTPLDIGRGVQVRAIGNVKLGENGWQVTHLNCSRTDDREVSGSMTERARDIIESLVSAWADVHEGDIAQADDIDRNNGARTIEENIARHEEALAILRAELRQCEEGEPFTQYPDLPTKR